MNVSEILWRIDSGEIALPEFQRGYVWNRDQVRGLMQSLYRRYPVGSLLVWTTRTDAAATRGGRAPAPGLVKLLLDGQQRITTLYGIIRGCPPKFFDGNPHAFTGLWFNIESEEFQFYTPLKMKDEPRWMNVTELMQKGLGTTFGRLAQFPGKQELYFGRLAKLHGIADIVFHIDDITGEDKTVDLVVDIFNRVNSGGTKLSKGDLALARICAAWPDARDEMKTRLAKWAKHGFDFRLELLLRGITTITTGQAMFEKLADIDTATFREGLRQTERAYDLLLDAIGSRLGLDFDRVLGSRSSFPLMARYLVDRGFKLDPARESGQLLYWYVNTFLWGRYAGSTETVLNKDLALIDRNEGALGRLVGGLRSDRGDLQVRASDFVGWSQGARFYPLLYMLTRTGRACDWGTGLELSAHTVGWGSSLDLHHVFPKALLYKHGHEKADVNALGNLTFLSKSTNIALSDRDPAQYFEEVEAKLPGALATHWIPQDRSLWRIERYHDFLAARRELLARAANDFLQELWGEPVPAGIAPPGPPPPEMSGGFADADEERELAAINDWVAAQGLPHGELLYELSDVETGAPLGILDLAWPLGLQPGLSHPVAILIDEPEAVQVAASAAGFQFFTSGEAFQRYVLAECLATVDAAA